MTAEVTCELCRKAVSVNSAKYIPKGADAKMLICSNCYNNRNNLESTTPYYSKSSPKKHQYFCARCRYNFKHDPKSFKLSCPYCGKADQLVERKEKTAAEILNSLED